MKLSYEYIGLSARGNAFVEGFFCSAYKVFIAEWEALLVKYLEDKC